METIWRCACVMTMPLSGMLAMSAPKAIGTSSSGSNCFTTPKNNKTATTAHIVYICQVMAKMPIPETNSAKDCISSCILVY